jgi:hypothetical protein
MNNGHWHKKEYDLIESIQFQSLKNYKTDTTLYTSGIKIDLDKNHQFILNWVKSLWEKRVVTQGQSTTPQMKGKYFYNRESLI